MQNQSNVDGIFTRPEFLEEFAYRYKSGQHVILIGPTGRGKTTLLGQMLSVITVTDAVCKVLVSIQMGADKALMHLGKPVNRWPPSMLGMQLYDAEQEHKPLIRRYQPLPKKPEHFIAIRRQAASILRWAFAREGLILVLPDLQLISDPGMMGLGKEVDQLILTLRKKGSGLFMDAQAPRWIPRSSTDNTQHLLIWRNRDEDTVDRLRKIFGIDKALLLNLFREMDYHDCVWLDVTADQYFIVRSK